MLSEEMETSNKSLNLGQDFKLGVLLWVDDVVSLVEGIENQEQMLEKVDNFDAYK